MNLTAFDVYLVYQLDSIGTVLGMASFLLLFLSLVCIASLLTDEIPIPRRAARWCIAIHLLVVASATLCPSTDTMLKMIVVPELVNSRIVQTDMPELYNLAVESLKKSLNPTAK